MSLNFLRLILLTMLVLLLAPISKADYTIPMQFQDNSGSIVGSPAKSVCDQWAATTTKQCNALSHITSTIRHYDCFNPVNSTVCSDWKVSSITCPTFHNGNAFIRRNITDETCEYEDDPGCVSPEVYNPSTGLCEVPPECSDAQGTIKYIYSGSTNPTICFNDCQYVYNNTGFGLTITNQVDLYGTTSQYVSTGADCNGNEPTNAQASNTDVTDSDADGIPEIDGQELPPTPPPSNGCVLLGDGSMYCGGGASTPPSPDNGTQGVGATPDQTVTNTTTNTTNNYYSPSTTSGSSTGTPDGQDDGVCDPSTEVCGTDEESATDGGCGQLPTCSGDSIQCVILKMQHDTRCNLQSDIEDVSETEVMAQIGVSETVEEYFEVDPNDTDSNFDLSGIINVTPGTSTCPADLSISVPFMATNVVIPNQPICDFFAFLRPAILALSYLVSGLMLFRAFSQGL